MSYILEPPEQPSQAHTYVFVYIYNPLSTMMMIQFGCSSSTRNGLKCAQVEYFKLLVSVLGGYMLILIDRLKAVPQPPLPISVCLSVWRLVKLISLCCTFPLRHVLDKTSPASREQGCICCLKLMDDVGTVYVRSMWHCQQPDRVEGSGEGGYTCLCIAQPI